LSGYQVLREDIEVDGRRIETVRYIGSRQSTIVMLHEGLGSVSTWKDFPERVSTATRCDVLVYSRYGHGNSERLAEKRAVDFMHHEAWVVLPELLKRFAIRSPILLGHSDGASIALIYAGTAKEKPAGLILEAPHVLVEEMTVASIAAIGTAYKAGDLQTKFARHHAHADEMFWGWNDAWLDPQFRDWNIEEYLGAIPCPILVIQGEQDEYGSGAQIRAIEAAASQTESLLLANCGHAPHRDQPERTLDAIVKFVSTLSKRTD
jgi:pimeloyl-ACP methyl ester carboxylesterase